MTTISEVNFAIMQGDFTNDQLDSIMSAIKFRRGQISKQTKRAITIGSQVKFTSNRNGMTYSGVVEKIAIKNVIVRTPLGGYRVPANMLEVV
jgi:hypothetical protein